MSTPKYAPICSMVLARFLTSSSEDSEDVADSARREALRKSTRRRKKGRKFPREPKGRPRRDVVVKKKAEMASSTKNARRPNTYLDKKGRDYLH